MKHYNCAACEDPKQGSPTVEPGAYVAKNNVPKYWVLCVHHYRRLDDVAKTHYARML